MGKQSMSKIRKRILVLIGVILVCAYIVRVYYVNKDVDIPVIKEYSLGTEVPYEKDYTNDSTECIDGYAATVLGYEVLSREEVYSRCGQNAEEESDGDNEYYVLVNASFANESFDQGETMGVNLYNTPIVCVNEYVILDRQLFEMLNPDMPGVGFSLRQGTSKDVTLVYHIRKGTFKDKQEIEDADFKLQITEYPTQKLLKLK